MVLEVVFRNVLVTSDERVAVARALVGTHPAVNLVKHVSVEVAALHKWLRLSSVLFSAKSGDSGRQIACLERKDAANDKND